MNDKLKVTSKTPRAVQSREKTTRRKPWAPPSSLDAPPAPAGFKHRWIRAETLGLEDNKNLSARLREGFELVRADSYEDEYPSIQDGKYKGVIGVGGLLLMRCPIEVKEDRDKYFESLTDDQRKSIENDLMKEEHPSMPISKERQSRVEFGRNKKS